MTESPEALRPPEGAAPAAAQKQFLTFRLGREEYGVDIMHVREIKGWTEPTRIPHAPPYMRGVINLRGLIVPVFDLHARFGMGVIEAKEKNAVIILAARDRHIGILVDAVCDIVAVAEGDIQPAPVEKMQTDKAYVTGLIAPGGRMTVLIDVSELFAKEAMPAGGGGAALLVLAVLLILVPQASHATPAFALQTSQPCSACHIGAYGPQLTPYGRDFKLYGYVSNDGQDHWPPLALMDRTTFTHTKDKQDPPPEWFGSNSNFAVGEVSLFYTGKVTDNIGVYLEPVSYDGGSRTYGWANSEARMVHEGKLLGQDYIAGITVNNAPTVSDLWNSTNQWGWPFDVSGQAPTPAAGTVLGDGLAQFAVGGAGGYAMVDDWVYAEADLYRGLSGRTREDFGVVPVTGSDAYDNLMPYWRLALQHLYDHDHQYWEVGTLGLVADVNPAGINPAGAQDDRKTDIGFDANYQWFGAHDDHIVSAHALYVHESLDLHASEVLTGSNPTDLLQEFKANVSYAYKNTWIPTIGYFRTWGTDDASGYWGTSTGSASPNSEGYTFELTYVPWGKPDSPFPGFNARLELQYTGYTQFDGVRSHAGDNNTIFVNLGLFWDPVPAIKQLAQPAEAANPNLKE